MPKISRVNDKNIKVSGTCFMGTLRATYSQIVSKLGSPDDSFDSYKTDAEWVIEFEDGTVATIYNWKDGKNYCGESGLDVSEITEWHIGGCRPHVETWVVDYIHNSWPVFDDIRQEAQF
jgi:hypothetical protein